MLVRRCALARQFARPASPRCRFGLLPRAFCLRRLIRWPETAGLRSNPVHEPGHVGMRNERFQRIELTFERFLRKQRMDVVVTRPAKPRDSLLHVGPFEVASVTLIRMARARDQMVARQDAHSPSAQFTMFVLDHDAPIDAWLPVRRLDAQRWRISSRENRQPVSRRIDRVVTGCNAVNRAGGERNTQVRGAKFGRRRLAEVEYSCLFVSFCGDRNLCRPWRKPGFKTFALTKGNGAAFLYGTLGANVAQR